MTHDDMPRENALYDLLMVGLLRSGEAEPEKVWFPAHTIFGAVWQTRLWPQYFTTTVGSLSALRNRVQLASHTVRVAVIRKSEILTEAAATEQPLLMIVNPRRGDSGMLNYARILGPGGYPLVLCEKGKEYAHEAQERFPKLTLQQFLAGFARFNSLRRHERTV